MHLNHQKNKPGEIHYRGTHACRLRGRIQHRPQYDINQKHHRKTNMEENEEAFPGRFQWLVAELWLIGIRRGPRVVRLYGLSGYIVGESIPPSGLSKRKKFGRPIRQL